MDLLGFEAKNVFSHNSSQEGNIGYTYNQASKSILDKYENTINVLQKTISTLENQIQLLQSFTKRN
ncbi:MAG: hypothetical protein M9911_00180 [Saprospiraceae bacterium]|nr:hypothetical protein [Saprospiraceae bacterium]